MRLLATRALPGALVLILAVALGRSELALAVPTGPLSTATLVALGVVALLGAVFRRFRVTAAALLLGGIAWGVSAASAVNPQPALLEQLVRNAVVFLASLDLLWLAASRERSVWSEGTVIPLLLIVSQPLLVAYVWMSYQQRLMTALDLPLPDALGGRLFGVGAIPAAVALVAVVLVAARSAHTTGPVEISMGWTLLALVGAATPGLWPSGVGIMVAAATVTVAIGMFQALFALAFLDQLTGLPARRALDETLAAASGPFVLAMVDVDHFKACNDTYGHDVGDQVLRMVAGRLREVGGGGLAFRYGGEEFAIVFRGLALDEARTHVEAARKAVEGSAFTLRDVDRPPTKPKDPRPGKGAKPTISVTVSAGLARHSGDGQPSDALRAADRALYRAKSAGRNRLEG